MFASTPSGAQCARATRAPPVIETAAVEATHSPRDVRTYRHGYVEDFQRLPDSDDHSRATNKHVVRRQKNINHYTYYPSTYWTIAIEFANLTVYWNGMEKSCDWQFISPGARYILK